MNRKHWHCPFVALLGALWLAGWAPAIASAQHPLGPVEERSLDRLLTLPGEEVVVRYTHGSLDRSARLQGRLIDLQQQLQRWTKVKTPFVVYVLSPKEWEAQGLFREYGFPVRTAPMTVAVPGWGTADTVELWRGLTGTSMPGAGGEFTVRGTAEEAATMTLADGFAHLEFCRMFVERHRMVTGAEAVWLQEVLAHLLLISYTQQSKLPPLVDLTALLTTMAGPTGAPQALATYHAELPLDQWLARHAGFAQAAEEIWRVDGKGAFRSLWKVRSKGGAPLSFRDVTSQYPGLLRWWEERSGPTP